MAHDILSHGLIAESEGDATAARDAMRRAERVLVGALASLDLDGSFTAEHVFEVFERATFVLSRGRAGTRCGALAEAHGLLAPLAAIAFPDEHDEPHLRHWADVH